MLVVLLFFLPPPPKAAEDSLSGAVPGVPDPVGAPGGPGAAGSGGLLSGPGPLHPEEPPSAQGCPCSATAGPGTTLHPGEVTPYKLYAVSI